MSQTQKKIYILLFVAIAFLSGMVAAYLVYLYKRTPPTPPFPSPKEVVFESSNLPIVIIKTEGDKNKMTKTNSISTYITVIDNGKDTLNYPNLDIHPDQFIDFEGEAAVRFRGYGSNMEPKKSYALKLVVKADGKKYKKKILGMKKSSKWALLAVHRDGAMMRDALTYELAKPYFDYVPRTKYCELVIDGVYHGVYLLAEVVDNDRLGLKKSYEEGLEGGYILEKDDGQSFLSKFPPLKIKGDPYETENIWFEIKYPKEENITSEQIAHVENDIYKIENAINGNAFEDLENMIDVESFINYQLVQEASNNLDAYSRSVKLFMPNYGTRKLKMVLWDFDIAYGAVDMLGTRFTNIWRYNYPRYTFVQLSWWNTLMKNEKYREGLKKQWALFREGNYSNEYIDNKIDSLYNLLTIQGAIERNSMAWDRFTYSNTSRIMPRISYSEEVRYLRLWFATRLEYMDRELLNKTYDQVLCDSLYRELGTQIVNGK